MRVLVCGSRDFDDAEMIFMVLDGQHRLQPIACIIEGEAPGADTIARVWAEDVGIEVARFPADWKQYGKAAGPIRNKQMLVEGKPDLVLAFPKGPLSESKGTKNMVGQAEAAGVRVVVYGPLTDIDDRSKKRV